MEEFKSDNFPEVEERDWFRKLHAETGQEKWAGPTYHLTWKDGGESIFLDLEKGTTEDGIDLCGGDIFRLRDKKPEILYWVRDNPYMPRHVRMICSEIFNSKSTIDAEFRAWVRYNFYGL